MTEILSIQNRLSIRLSITSILVSVGIVFRIASPVTADLSYVLLAVLALMGRRQVIIALALSWLFTMANPGLVPTSSFGTIGRFLVIIAAATSIVLRMRPLVDRHASALTWVTVVFSVFVFFHSLFVSPYPHVSLLKLFSWLLVFLALLHAWIGMKLETRVKVANQLFWALVVLSLVSLPLMFHDVGYLRNGTGFQGVLNHPQAFGVTMALLGAWSIGRLLTARRFLLLEFAIFLLALFLILSSKTRTAGLALILAIVLSLLIARVSSLKRLHVLVPAIRSKKFRLMLMFSVIVMIGASPVLLQIVNVFITKSGRTQVVDIVTAYEVSRGVLYIPILDNIANNPWRGIGYGIASDPNALIIQRDAVFGLPVSASVEKGVMPLVVLEELGIWGFSIFLVWLLIAFRCALRGGLLALSLFFVVLLINLGEAIFFSPGGLGLLTILLFTYAMAIGIARCENVRGPT
jgi:hypothetical protein